ncbi:MAG TPA: serine protease [Pyrinomonadaceae bacterium]
MRIRKRASVFFVLLSLAPFGQALGAQAVRGRVNHYRQQSNGSDRPQSSDAVLDGIVTILIEDDNRTQAVGSGLIVRGDGLILTAYHLVKGALAVHVRLRSGETFERAELVATDERRNVAVLRIPASGLYSLSGAVTEESWVGSPVMVVSNATVETRNAAGGILSSVSLSDEIAGAGAGYRVLRFTAPVPPGAAGGLLVDERGRALGLLAAAPQSAGQNYAVPLSSLVGLVGSVGVPPALLSARASAAAAPVPIPQNTVSVPQRPVSPLAPKGPGSVVVKPSRPVDVLLASKTIYVTTNTAFFKPEQLINELRKRAELDQWGLTFVDDVQVADLVLTLDHIVFTYKFTFTLSHQRTGVIVATGNVIIWDGNTGAEQMARRVIDKLTQVRAQAPTK